MNKNEYCRLASNLIKKLEQKHEEVITDAASIEKLLINLSTLREFLWTDKNHIVGFIFDKDSKGAYIYKNLYAIREVFIDKGYDAAVQKAIDMVKEVEVHLAELDDDTASTPTPVPPTIPYDKQKFLDIKKFYCLKSNEAVMKLLVNMAHAELDETKSKFIRAKKQGTKPSNITKKYGINYNQVKKLSEQYKDV